MKGLLGVILALIATQTFSGAATILFTAKKVVAKKGGAERTLSRGSSVDAGDTIVTAEAALVKIKYTNGTLITLGEKASYTILAYSPKSKDDQIKAELKQGKLGLKTTGKVKESLKTPTVALAIRGTELNVATTPTQTLAVLKSGVATATDSKGNTMTMPINQPIAATPTGITDAPAGTVLAAPTTADNTAPSDSNPSGTTSSTDGSSSTSSGTSSSSSSGSSSSSANTSSGTGMTQVISGSYVGTTTSSTTQTITDVTASTATIALAGCIQ